MQPELTTVIDAENPVLHDLKIVNGDFVMIGGDINDAESYSKEVAQTIKCRLLFDQGEWYLDQLIGFPWSSKVKGKAGIVTGEEGIKKLLKSAIMSVPGVKSIEELSVEISRQTRRLTITGTINTDMDTQITINDLTRPYIVSEQ